VVPVKVDNGDSIRHFSGLNIVLLILESLHVSLGIDLRATFFFVGVGLFLLRIRAVFRR
jgi:hypothetical protein